MTLARFDYTNLLKGSGVKGGISATELKRLQKTAAHVFREVESDRKKGKTPYRELPYKSNYVREVLKIRKKWGEGIENFVVLGIGGSALGNIALQTALNPPTWNMLDGKSRRNHPRIFVLDNVDPELIAAHLDLLDPRKTLINVISKSGTTAEAMANFLVFHRWLRRSRVDLRNHVIVTTDESRGVLRKIVVKEGFDSLVVPDGVGGRFSVLSPVGLLSAAFGGINIRKLLRGAALADRVCSRSLPAENPALMNALLHFALARKGYTNTVIMPYSNALARLGDWFVQLWAESLGKKYSLSGKVVYAGLTPQGAIGATDQHSQVQLFNEGPFDKVINFIRIGRFRRSVRIPSSYREFDELSYLGGRKIEELLDAEYRGTALALTRNRRPNCTMELSRIDEETVGFLIYMLEVQTSFMGYLLDIDTYDQPGVEAGKINTYALMGRKGFEKQAKEIRTEMRKRKKNEITVP